MHCSKLMCEKEFFATFVVFYAGEFNFNWLNDVDFRHKYGEELIKFHEKFFKGKKILHGLCQYVKFQELFEMERRILWNLVTGMGIQFWFRSTILTSAETYMARQLPWRLCWQSAVQIQWWNWGIASRCDRRLFWICPLV
jgi:hypothetical protein